MSSFLLGSYGSLPCAAAQPRQRSRCMPVARAYDSAVQHRRRQNSCAGCFIRYQRDHQVTTILPQCGRSSSRRTTVRCSAVFERFSERSIKSVMIAQQEAKNLGASEVCAFSCPEAAYGREHSSGSQSRGSVCSQVTTEHVLLGLVAEETGSKNGFLNSGLTVEKARAAVESLSGKRKPNSTHDNIPFSREVRKTFEAATNVSFRLETRAVWCHRQCQTQPHKLVQLLQHHMLAISCRSASGQLCLTSRQNTSCSPCSISQEPQGSGFWTGAMCSCLLYSAAALDVQPAVTLLRPAAPG